MADSAGLDALTGRTLTDWEHVEQSIRTILTTPIGSRVMRREFGSTIPDLIDSKMLQRNVLAVYVAAAEALDRWEPRFRLTHCGIRDANAAGRIDLSLFGLYYPRGHLGDYSIVRDASTRVVASNFR